ncbi:MAG: TonB-dependent receptor, partial [Bacteroidota bacterium]
RYGEQAVIIGSKNSLTTEYTADYYISREEANRAAMMGREEAEAPIIIGEASRANASGKARFKGFVTDDNTGEGIIGATIFIQETGSGTVSNETGAYELSLNIGEYNIQITSIGYQSIERRLIVYSDAEVDLALSKEAVTLEEVVVEAESADINIKSTDIGVERLSTKTIKKLPAFLGEVDVVKSLLLLPGVSTVGEGAGGFNVRGGNIDQNLIMQDGAVMFNTSHVLGFFSLFNPDMVKGLTLYKGSMPSRYGGRLASVLDVEMKEGSFNQWTAKGGIGVVSSRLVVEGPVKKGKSSLIIGGRSSYSDWILSLIPVEEVKESDAFFYDANIKFTQRLGDRARIIASGYSSFDRFRFADEFAFEWSTQTANVQWKQIWGDRLSSSVTTIYNRYRSSLQDPVGNDAFDFESGIDYLKVQPNFIFVPNDWQTINAGLEWINYEVMPGAVSPTGSISTIIPDALNSEKGREFSAYINDEIKWGDRFSINAGLRYTLYQSLGPDQIFLYSEEGPLAVENIVDSLSFNSGEVIETYTGLEPRIGLNIIIDETASVKLSYNRTYQYINQISNTTSVTPVDIWQLSNRYIRPQQADSYSIGFFKNFRNNRWETSIEAYYRDINRLIEFRDRADLLVNNHLETELLEGVGRAYGVELSLKRKIGRVTGWLGYTYSRTERKIDSDVRSERINLGEWYPSNFDKPHDLTIVMNYQINKRNSFAVNFTYSTGRPVTAPVGKFISGNVLSIPNYSLRNQFRIPDYHRLDISYTLDTSHKKNKAWESSWTFAVYNLYARRNAYSVFYTQKPFQDPVANKFSVLGSAFPALTYNFKF